MTVNPSINHVDEALINPARLLEEQLDQASPDLLRELLSSFINTLLSAEADAVCGAGYGVVSPERVNRRNGYRRRDFDTRTGTIDVAIPKLRQDSYFPEWLLERRKRAERALTSVVATCYLLGVSTRRMDKLVASLGITSLSKSQVSQMARDLDDQVRQFRTRRLDGPYTFVAADALVIKVREGGRVVGVHALVATGVNADGHREILGLQVTSAEDGAGWLAFFRDLVARGLTGVRLGHLRRPPRPGRSHRSDPARRGLATLPHPLRRQPDVGHPKASWPWVKTLLHSIYDQPDTGAVHAQFERVVDALTEKLPAVAAHLDDARADILAFTSFPKEIWRQIWSNNPNERLNREIRRRTDVVGIFPDRDAIIRLIGAVLAEQHDEWAEGRRYLGLDVLTRSRDTKINNPGETDNQLTPQAITA